MAGGRGGVRWLFSRGCRRHRPTRASQEARDLTGSRMHSGHHNSNRPHNLAMDEAHDLQIGPIARRLAADPW